jgi:DNA-binding transcriptional LysR family regulator
MASAWRWPQSRWSKPRWLPDVWCMPFDIVIRRTQAYYLVVPEAVADRPIVSVFRDWLRSEAAKVAEE